MRFVDGRPVELDGKKPPFADLVAELDRRAGAHGAGRIDMVEALSMEQELSEHKRAEEGRYAQQIYNELWWGR